MREPDPDGGAPDVVATRWRWGVAVAALVSVLLRLRFVWTPLTSDEGGFLSIARAWRHGAVLYRDVWVDRPQGLLAVFRVWDTIGLGSPEGIRVLAILAGVLAVLACASIARTLFDPAAAVLAALFVAVLSSVPQIEGFIANGELLSGAVGAAALAVALRALQAASPMRISRLYAAGLLGGAAISIKQSGFDAVVTGALACMGTALAQPEVRKAALRGAAAIVAGIATVLAVLLVHGALTGWSRWWYAFVGYRLEQRSIATNADFSRFSFTWHIAAPIVLPAIAATVACLLARWRSAMSLRVGVLVTWMALATLAFAAGGQFHRHYWVILSFPLGTVAAAAISLQPRRWMRVTLAALVVAVPLWRAGQGIALSRDQVALKLSDDGRLVHNEALGHWFETNAKPGESLYVLCASAAAYASAHTDPPYPFLWMDNVLQARGAQAQLRSLLTAPRRPTYVAVYQRPQDCDPSGTVAAALDEHYERVGSVSGVAVYRALI